MKAIVHTRYGPPDVLQIKELGKPSPQDDEVLIRVRAVAVTATNAIFRRWNQLAARLFTGIIRPKSVVPGFELAGDIEAVGRDVNRFKVGDPVSEVALSASSSTRDLEKSHPKTTPFPFSSSKCLAIGRG